LLGSNNIHNEARYVESNIPIVLNAEFICSVNISPLSGVRRFLDRKGGRARKHKNCQTSPSNQKCL